MSTSIRVSEETKDKLERLRGEDETYDDLLARLADMEAAMAHAAGSWSDTGKAAAAREARDRTRESFGR